MPAQTRSKKVGRGAARGSGRGRRRGPYARPNNVQNQANSDIDLEPFYNNNLEIVAPAQLNFLPQSLPETHNSSSVIQSDTSTRADSFISVKMIPSLISKCDGSENALHNFMKQSRRAERLCNPNEKHIFIEILLSRLEGDAARVVQRAGDVRSVEDILNALKAHFTPPIHIDQALAELNKLSQAEGETASAFGLRVAERLEFGQESVKESYAPSQLPGVAASLTDCALRAYMNGLRDQQEARIIISHKPASLQEAIKRATAAERDKPAQILKFPVSIPVASVNTLNSKKTVECYNCHQLGHIKRYCPTAPTERRRIHCNFCKKAGHTEDKCFKKHPHLRARKIPRQPEQIREEQKDTLNSSRQEEEPKK